ncbi:unnamed protein product [Paramecium pentaurelia]|uniref:Uncharacterized protein n=1 Tax=Paramecium pentaurelia TaxID=43138 RepID=A0A8S1XS88_9CILI|nr:unnamed protein product [Paramecium pentaurelia]
MKKFLVHIFIKVMLDRPIKLFIRIFQVFYIDSKPLNQLDSPIPLDNEQGTKDNLIWVDYNSFIINQNQSVCRLFKITELICKDESFQMK